MRVTLGPTDGRSESSATSVNDLLADSINSGGEPLLYPRIEVDSLVMEYFEAELEKTKMTGGARFDSVAAMTSVMSLAMEYAKSNDIARVNALLLTCSQLLKWTMDMGGKRLSLLERVKKKISPSIDTLFGHKQHSLLHITIKGGKFHFCTSPSLQRN